MPQPVPVFNCQACSLQIAEQFLCFILLYGFLYIQHLSPYGSGSELDLNDIACLYIQGSLGRFVIDQNASCVAGFICYGPALDQAGNLKKLVKSHELLINLIL